jgi:hydrogenase-1 operon protein HyaE
MTAAIHPLLDQLVTTHAFVELDAARFDAFAAAPGRALVVFADDPVRYKETLDLAVIAPQIVRAFDGLFRAGVLFAEAASALAPRFGLRRRPALVVLADGAYVGAIEGLRNWDEYVSGVGELAVAPPISARRSGEIA